MKERKPAKQAIAVHKVFLVTSKQENLRVLNIPASEKVDPSAIFLKNQDADEMYINYYSAKGAPARQWFARFQFKPELFNKG